MSTAICMDCGKKKSEITASNDNRLALANPLPPSTITGSRCEPITASNKNDRLCGIKFPQPVFFLLKVVKGLRLRNALPYLYSMPFIFFQNSLKAFEGFLPAFFERLTCWQSG